MPRPPPDPRIPGSRMTCAGYRAPTAAFLLRDAVLELRVINESLGLALSSFLSGGLLCGCGLLGCRLLRCGLLGCRLLRCGLLGCRLLRCGLLGCRLLYERRDAVARA